MPETEPDRQPAEPAIVTTVLTVPCQAAAPLVVNGAPFVGCHLPMGHPGQHEVIITWATR